MQKTNGELNEMIESFKTYMSSELGHINKSLDDLTEQVKYTNGKVRWSEKLIYGAIIGLGVVSTMVIPLLIYIWNQRNNFDEKLSQAIDQQVQTVVERTFKEYEPSQ